MLKCVEIRRAPSIGTVKHSIVFIEAGVVRRGHADHASNDGICEEGSTSCTLRIEPKIIRTIMLWRPNTVFARALSNATQGAHRNKHGVDSAFILFGQYPHYLYSFSS